LLLAALEEAFSLRIPLAVATVLEGSQIGRRAFAGIEDARLETSGQNINAVGVLRDGLKDLAQNAMASRESMESLIAIDEINARAWADYRPARPGLWIFGAGDDAQPLLRLAKELGLFVSVADGRSHLATRERFPRADQVNILPVKEISINPSDSAMAALSNLHPEDAVVVMTHSFEQDSRILNCLLALRTWPAYIGVLGPRRRTRELLTEVASLLNLPSTSIAAQAERWLNQLHAPTGLDLGAESPETIALSVLAEIQKVRTSSTALPLRTIRASTESIAS
jgi:xanthine/CO dehydrogenase XdhC/CoxF family maturation factor